MGVASLQLDGHLDVTCYWNLWSEFSLIGIRAWKLKPANLISFAFNLYLSSIRCVDEVLITTSFHFFPDRLHGKPPSSQLRSVLYSWGSGIRPHLHCLNTLLSPVNYDTKRSYESLPINIKHNLRVEQMLE